MSLHAQQSIEAVIERLLAAEKSCGFTNEEYGKQEGFNLCCATRHNSNRLKTVYLSSGMHGDEPAGSLAILKLLEDRILPLDEFNWALCPMLNPVGLSLHQRGNRAGIDLNRDYLTRKTHEVRAHTRWVDQQSHFDLALFYHEDWEVEGFYLHECQICENRSKVQAIIDAVSVICPVDLAGNIDGMHASKSIVHPWRESKFANRWMESFYLRAHKADMGFIFETPSSLDLTIRVDAHIAATLSALDLLRNPG